MEDENTTDSEEPKRKPYERPRVVKSAQFETLALQCSFSPGTACEGPPDFNPSTS